MKPRQPLIPVLVALGCLLLPATAMGTGALSGAAHRASAALDFRIVIPPVMRVMENEHPLQLTAAADGPTRAEQRLVVMSNMKRGFCATLRLASADVRGWQLQAAEHSAARLETVTDGYRVCVSRPGQYTLVLQHAFDTRPGHDQAAVQWPIRTDLTTL